MGGSMGQSFTPLFGDFFSRNLVSLGHFRSKNRKFHHLSPGSQGEPEGWENQTEQVLARARHCVFQSMVKVLTAFSHCVTLNYDVECS